MRPPRPATTTTASTRTSASCLTRSRVKARAAVTSDRSRRTSSTRATAAVERSLARATRRAPSANWSARTRHRRHSHSTPAPSRARQSSTPTTRPIAGLAASRRTRSRVSWRCRLGRQGPLPLGARASRTARVVRREHGASDQGSTNPPPHSTWSPPRSRPGVHTLIAGLHLATGRRDRLEPEQTASGALTRRLGRRSPRASLTATDARRARDRAQRSQSARQSGQVTR